MPVIGCGDGDGVDGFVGENLAEVFDGPAVGEAEPPGLRLRAFESGLIDIAHRGDLHARSFAGKPDVAGPHPAGSDECHVELLIRPAEIAGEERGGESRAARSLQEVAAYKGFRCHAFSCIRFEGE